MHETDYLKFKEGNSARRYARPEVADALQAIALEWSRLHPDRPITVGDISKKGGGELPPHLSHQKGVDMDVNLMSIDVNGPRGIFGKDNYSQDLHQGTHQNVC